MTLYSIVACQLVLVLVLVLEDEERRTEGG